MINNKPIYLWPFILVYRLVTLVLKVPILFVHYFGLGIYFTVYCLIDLLIMVFAPILKYSFLGFMFLCYSLFCGVKVVAKSIGLIFKYLITGISFPFVAFYKNYTSEEQKQKRKEAKEKQAQVRLENKLKQQEKQKIAEAQKQEALMIKKQEAEKIRLQKEQKKQEQLALKEKLKLEKEEKQRMAEAKKQEALLIKKQEAEKIKLEKETKKQEETQKRLEEQQKKNEKQEVSDNDYVIHAPQNEILAEEKQDDLRINKTLTKEERKQLKLEKIAKKKEEKEAKRLEKEKMVNLSKEEKKKLKLEKLAKKKEERAKRLEDKKKEQQKINDVYINENVTIEKVTFAAKLKKTLNDINNLPTTIAEAFRKSWNNSSFVKNSRNRQDMNRQALLINFDGEDAVKSDKKVVYEYVGKNAEGKIIKGYFEAFSKVEVHSFLLSEGYEVYSIKTSRLIQLLHGRSGSSRTRIKTKDLIFFLTQLSTYIKAGIPLVEALKILSRQYKNKNYERIFRAIVYDLTMGENFSEALSKQGNAFPRLLINMIKASEMTGELPEALDDMADYYTETDKTRKQMITAMMYPSIIFIISLAAITFIMVFVVPKFVTIYESMDNARLPWITQMVISISNFLETKAVLIIIVVVAVITLLVVLYKKFRPFRTLVQWLVMHLPVFGNVVIYNEITMFTKTFCSLLRHNVFITDSMEILNKITNNEIYKMIILDTITNLAKGEKISLAFKDHWAVPIPAYEMIVTGERTGQLPEMMGKVSAYYQEMHKNAVTRIKTFIEPALILFLTVMVGGIVLSIVVPMFDMYNNMGL